MFQYFAQPLVPPLAEMALATLHDTPVLVENSIYTLKLSHSPTLEDPLPEIRLCPQLIKGESDGHHLLYDASLQDVFTWFRQAGPLVSVKRGATVEPNQSTCVVEYWKAEHAEYAQEHCRTMHPSLAKLKPFDLRAYYPSKLVCSVSSFLFRAYPWMYCC